MKTNTKKSVNLRSLQECGPEKKSCKDKLRIVVKEIGRSYANVMNSLEDTLREDE